MTDTFLGIPITGEISRADIKPQRPIEDLAPILQAVLDDPTVVEFGWRQCTPGFNDGDPCRFSTYGTWLRTTSDTDAETYDLDLDIHHPSLGNRSRTYNRETREYDYSPYEGPDEARYDRCRALYDAIDGGEFYSVLQEKFGDPAEVTVRRDGIQVDYYDHG